MSRTAKILIIEDEQAIRAGLIDVLVYHGFAPDAAEDGQSGLDKALSGQYDLILLDVMLPKLNGFEVCERIREADREQAIIMLTAKSGDEDIIHGLQLGADDYVAKPFSVAQLVERIKAVLRRAKVGQEEAHTLCFGEMEVDTRNLCGRRNNDEIAFTRREMDVLQYLHKHSDRPVPREELLARLWGYARNLNIETRTVDIHIAKLRRKIEPDPAQPQHLLTVRGAGYRLMVD
ncbi:MAG: DNA-binding response regulator [Gammaproteobacteria bacterium]|nr:MAG: DNA-binding response regulator [Gammaproteobacteria bacterium]